MKATKKTLVILLSLVVLLSFAAIPAYADSDNVISAKVEAVVTKAPGNTNILTITIQANTCTYTEEFVISNNSEGYFDVHGYKVYVSTFGNDKIRQCYIVSFEPSIPTVGIGIKNATQAEILDAVKETKADPAASGIMATAAVTIPTWTQRVVTYFGQDYYYSCGAACARMVLWDLTGKTYTESAVRTGCKTTIYGTSMTDIKYYLNSQQSKNSYVGVFSATKATMKSNLYSGIVTYKAPPIIAVKETTPTWPFSLAVHGVVIYGVLSDQSKVKIHDPWAGYAGSTKKSYEMTTDNLYNGYISSAGYIW